jgi:hypothetical protein
VHCFHDPQAVAQAVESIHLRTQEQQRNIQGFLNLHPDPVQHDVSLGMVAQVFLKHISDLIKVYLICFGSDGSLEGYSDDDLLDITTNQHCFDIRVLGTNPNRLINEISAQEPINNKAGLCGLHQEGQFSESDQKLMKLTFSLTPARIPHTIFNGLSHIELLEKIV